MAKYLIIGGVAGGMSAAARLRRLDESAEIVVLERGGYVSYANCGLPYYVGDAIHERERLLLQTPHSFKQRFNVEVRIHHEALAIDPQQKRVRVRNVQSGAEHDESYDKLLLSPGGSPLVPPIPGVDHPAIHTLWTIPDTDKIRALVDGGTIRTALVVGAGFIGLEMAENLHARGIRVIIVELAEQALSVIDFEMAAHVHRELRNKGIELHLGDGVEAFTTQDGPGVSARLKSGQSVSADLVLLSIGVKPNTAFLADSGIALGARKHIIVDAQLRTNLPDIFAAGDAIEVVNPLTGKQTAIPLAGPANKQGRIAADNMHGATMRSYDGTMGTAIAKVFDLDVGMTGATEKFCRSEGLAAASIIIYPNDHAGYYPGATMLCLKLVFSPESRKVLGAQAIGSGGIDKRIDVIATAIQAGMTVDELTEIEHAYAPPYSSAKDPVNMAGFVAQNVLNGLVRNMTWDQLHQAPASAFYLLDVRTAAEFGNGTIPGAINIPVDALRQRIAEIPRDRSIVIFCRVGLRGYIAARILAGYGITDTCNLSGGYETYSLATGTQTLPPCDPQAEECPETAAPAQAVIRVDACGLQCPGPILRLKLEIDALPAGGLLEITASDPGFYADAQAWARSTGHLVRSISSDKGIVRALIEKGGTVSTTTTTSSGNDKTIIVFSGDLDKTIAAFVIANGALAMGRKVTIFFTFWGLNALRRPQPVRGLGKNLIETAFAWMMPRGSTRLTLSRMSMGGIGGQLIRGIMRQKHVPSLEEMMTLAIRNGATLIACQMSMDLMGIRKEELIDGLSYGGVATYLEASEHADNNLFI